MICVIINNLVGSTFVMTEKYFRVCLDTIEYLKRQKKVSFVFGGNPPKPFHGTLANLMKIYALIHLEVFRKSKMEQEPKYLIYDDVLTTSMINESSFIST